MMTYDMMVSAIEALEDVSCYVYNGVFRVTVEDFDGFDDEWNEVDAEYDEEAIEAFIEMLETEALSVEGDYYRTYQFDGFAVRVGYASFDI